jgi:hypothetical protein
VSHCYCSGHLQTERVCRTTMRHRHRGKQQQPPPNQALKRPKAKKLFGGAPVSTTPFLCPRLHERLGARSRSQLERLFFATRCQWQRHSHFRFLCYYVYPAGHSGCCSTWCIARHAAPCHSHQAPCPSTTRTPGQPASECVATSDAVTAPLTVTRGSHAAGACPQLPTFAARCRMLAVCPATPRAT